MDRGAGGAALGAAGRACWVQTGWLVGGVVGNGLGVGGVGLARGERGGLVHCQEVVGKPHGW